MRVQYAHRGDPEFDMSRLNELEAQLISATTPAERCTIQREIEIVRDNAEKQRPHMLYGWAVDADHAGKPLTTTRGMIGFILPSSPENDQAIAAMRKASTAPTIAVDREQAVELFTFSGRRWVQALRVALVRNTADIGDPPSFDLPPDQPMTEAQNKSFQTALTHNRSEARDDGGSLQRYTIKILNDNPPTGVATMRLWLAVHVEINGAVLGPIIDQIDIASSTKGGFSQSRSFEFITRSKVTMNPAATAASPVAVDWK